jgi:hypothetical protein
MLEYESFAEKAMHDNILSCDSVKTFMHIIEQLNKHNMKTDDYIESLNISNMQLIDSGISGSIYSINTDEHVLKIDELSKHINLILNTYVYINNNNVYIMEYYIPTVLLLLFNWFNNDAEHKYNSIAEKFPKSHAYIHNMKICYDEHTIQNVFIMNNIKYSSDMYTAYRDMYCGDILLLKKQIKTAINVLYYANVHKKFIYGDLKNRCNILVTAMHEPLIFIDTGGSYSLNSIFANTIGISKVVFPIEIMIVLAHYANMLLRMINVIVGDFDEILYIIDHVEANHSGELCGVLVSILRSLLYMSTLISPFDDDVTILLKILHIDIISVYKNMATYDTNIHFDKSAIFDAFIE